MDPFLNPANPASPLSPLNPANPASPFNPATSGGDPPDSSAVLFTLVFLVAGVVVAGIAWALLKD